MDKSERSEHKLSPLTSKKIKDGTVELPPVSEMIREAGLEPKKSLGQNFLFDLNITRKIARAIPDITKQTIVEVGPGPGGLTRALLETGAKKVIAIEKDTTTKPILEKIATTSNNRLEVIYADALKTDVSTLNSPLSTLSICANLPYNVGTELLTRWLARPDIISSMTLMFQKEVAERIVAKTSTKQYGRLSVLAQINWNAKILFTVPNTAFFPPPKVTSAIVQLTQKKTSSLILTVTPAKAGASSIQTLTAKLFGARRKMVRSLLDIDWSRYGLTGTERAENIPPEIYIKIAQDMV